MIIETITRIHISEANEALVPYLAHNKGLIKKNDEEMETVPEAVERIMNNCHRVAAYQEIVPDLERYFGIKDKAQFEVLIEALNNGSIEVITVIK
jgi:hypothetical protein